MTSSHSYTREQLLSMYDASLSPPPDSVFAEFRELQAPQRQHPLAFSAMSPLEKEQWTTMPINSSSVVGSGGNRGSDYRSASSQHFHSRGPGNRSRGAAPIGRYEDPSLASPAVNTVLDSHADHAAAGSVHDPSNAHGRSFRDSNWRRDSGSSLNANGSYRDDKSRSRFNSTNGGANTRAVGGGDDRTWRGSTSSNTNTGTGSGYNSNRDRWQNDGVPRKDSTDELDFISNAEVLKRGTFDANGHFIGGDESLEPSLLEPADSGLLNPRRTESAPIPFAFPNRPPGLRFEEQAVTAPTLPQPVFWYYRDPQGVEQGPFPETAMRSWHEQGLFSTTLEVRRGFEKEFRPLGSLSREFWEAPFQSNYRPPYQNSPDAHDDVFHIAHASVTSILDHDHANTLDHIISPEMPTFLQPPQSVQNTVMNAYQRPQTNPYAPFPFQQPFVQQQQQQPQHQVMQHLHQPRQPDLTNPYATHQYSPQYHLQPQQQQLQQQAYQPNHFAPPSSLPPFFSEQSPAVAPSFDPRSGDLWRSSLDSHATFAVDPQPAWILREPESALQTNERQPVVPSSFVSRESVTPSVPAANPAAHVPQAHAPVLGMVEARPAPQTTATTSAPVTTVEDSDDEGDHDDAWAVVPGQSPQQALAALQKHLQVFRASEPKNMNKNEKKRHRRTLKRLEARLVQLQQAVADAPLNDHSKPAAVTPAITTSSTAPVSAAAAVAGSSAERKGAPITAPTTPQRAQTTQPVVTQTPTPQTVHFPQMDTQFVNQTKSWVSEQLRSMNGEIDVQVVYGLLMEAETDADVGDTIRFALGDTARTALFCKQFLEKRREHKQLVERLRTNVAASTAAPAHPTRSAAKPSSGKPSNFTPSPSISRPVQPAPVSKTYDSPANVPRSGGFPWAAVPSAPVAFSGSSWPAGDSLGKGTAPRPVTSSTSVPVPAPAPLKSQPPAASTQLPPQPKPVATEQIETGKGGGKKKKSKGQRVDASEFLNYQVAAADTPNRGQIERIV